MLRSLLNSAAAGTLLLLEDIDAAFSAKRTASAASKDRTLTFSGQGFRTPSWPQNLLLPDCHGLMHAGTHVQRPRQRHPS